MATFGKFIGKLLLNAFDKSNKSRNFNIKLKPYMNPPEDAAGLELSQFGKVEVMAFRVVLTAGFALPTYQIILSIPNNPEQNTEAKVKKLFDKDRILEVTYNGGEAVSCRTVGHHVKTSANGDKILVNWGGTVAYDKLGESFLTEFGYHSKTYNDSAYNALKAAWKDLCGTEIDSNFETEKNPFKHKYRGNITQNRQEFLQYIFHHIDMRPSFPMVTIDSKGRLILRDFQTLKQQKPICVFVPTLDGPLGVLNSLKGIPYANKPEPVVYAPYANRKLAYNQITFTDKNTGKINVTAFDTTTDENKNKLSQSDETDANKAPIIVNDTKTITTSYENPAEFCAPEIYNRHSLLQMSAVSLKLTIEDYVAGLGVLDMVELRTQERNSDISGKWIVEAIEKGFVDEHVSSVIYLCREGLNRETAGAKKKGSFSDIISKKLRLSSTQKADIARRVKNSRQALTVAKGVMSKQYVNEFQAHLIGMRRGALGNFSLFGNTVNLNDAKSSAKGLMNAGTSLMTQMISSFIKAPFDMFFITAIGGSQTVMNLLMMILSLLFGGELYDAFSGLFADLRYFNQFLQNYNTNLDIALQESQPNYKAAITSGVITFIETPEGRLLPVVPEDNPLVETKKMSNVIQEEDKDEIREKVVAEIIENIPDSVDIPIPDFELTDSEAILPEDELKETIADKIVENLINRGYVYDSAVVGDTTKPQSTIITASGKTISYDTARATMASSDKVKDVLLGKGSFDSSTVSRIKTAIGSEIKVRHWGTFISFNDLSSFNINAGYVDKYKTLNDTKIFSCNGGKRIFVALPASEEGVKFYINSERSTELERNIMEVGDLGYVDTHGNPIPYNIYYTLEDFDTSALVLEMRKI